MFHRTLHCLRRAQVTIPRLSPTHTRAKIIRWCVDPTKSPNLQSYDPLFILKCSPDVVTEGFRNSPNHEPLMIVEAHDEGTLTLQQNIEMDTWYDCGTEIGVIDDDDDDEEDDGEWLWQAYSHEEE